MKLYAITFSPTGGTKKSAELLCQALGSSFEHIDLTSPRQDFTQYQLTSQDLCVVAVPSYGGRIPPVAALRLRELRGGGARAVGMVVYGNRAFEDTMVELQDVLCESFFVPVAFVAAVAQHSIMTQFAAGRPDEKDSVNAADFAESIRLKLADGVLEPVEGIPGSRPYKEFKVLPMLPAAGNDCINCTLCAQSCPVNAIPVAAPALTDPERCIYCMRCVSLCPVGARKPDPARVSAAVEKLSPICSVRKEWQLFL